MAIYNFARTADDLADEGQASATERLQALHQYRADLLGCTQPGFTSQGWPQVFSRLAAAIEAFSLPMNLLEALLSAFEQDVVKQRYTSQEELNDYCSRSANPVGRLLLHLYGITDETSLQQSDCICTALQLINFWQDLSVDIPRDRLYLPADSMALCGVNQDELMALRVTPNALKIVANNLAYARHTMLRGNELVKKIPGRSGWELALVVQGGLRIVEKIEALNFNTFEKRPTVKAWDVMLMAWRVVKFKITS